MICILKLQKLEMALGSNSQVFRIHHQGTARGLVEYELRELGGSNGGGRAGTAPSGGADNELSLKIQEADSGHDAQIKPTATLELSKERMAYDSLIFVMGYDLSDSHFSMVIERNEPRPSERGWKSTSFYDSDFNVIVAFLCITDFVVSWLTFSTLICLLSLCVVLLFETA